MTSWDRLSALDAHFLDLEHASTPMNNSGLMIFDATQFRDRHGAADIERLREMIASRIHQSPRLRMRIARTPLTGHPVWVDDPHFRLDYHVRYSALVPPGDRAALDEVIGQHLSQPLDRGKPLWEVHLFDGLESNRMAILTKFHHCMMDGMAGMGLMRTLLSPVSSRELPAPEPWLPQRRPDATSLLLSELQRRISGPRTMLRAAESVVRNAPAALGSFQRSTVGLWELLCSSLTQASDTPLNQPGSPYRQFRGLRLELTRLQAVKRALGGTINDIVIAAFAGALRTYLRDCDVDVDALSMRALLPVNLRHGGGADAQGNQIGVVAGDLPVDEPDTRRRYERVRAATVAAKASRITAGTNLLNLIGDLTHSVVITAASQLATRSRAYNVIITNMSGPQIPLYALESPLQEIYVTAPLWERQAVNCAVFSYAGFLHWGFVADAERVTRFDDLVACVADEISELEKVAAAG